MFLTYFVNPFSVLLQKENIFALHFFRLYSEKEKNGFKKAFLRVRRKPEKAGGQGRPPLRVQWEIRGCNDALQLLPDPHPSASQTPSPEGKAIRCGGDGRFFTENS